MKKIGIFILILAVSLLIGISYSQGKTSSYYSGDALAYNGNLFVASTNTGNLELFRLNGKKLDRLVKIRPFDQRFGKYGSFYDVHLRQEGSKLYAYAVTDFSIYKYEVVDNQSLNLVNSLQNSYWEWYNRVDEIDGKLITISANSVKLLNDNLQVIDEYDFSNNEVPYNISGSNGYLFNIQNEKLVIYDRGSRTVIKEIALNFKIERSAHKIYLDENNNLYVADDYYAKKYNLNGDLIGSFKHLDYESYDMTTSNFSSFVYFSNGIGVVKLNKETMKTAKWAWTGGVAGPRGWAMGLKVVELNGDKVVVFNNSNILVLDANLNKIASFLAEDEEINPYASENLFLNLDKSAAPTNSQLTINGGGFFPGEDLSISFAGSQQTVKADTRGRFQKTLTVPSVTAGNYDIKVTGLNSKLSYSISFRIQ